MWKWVSARNWLNIDKAVREEMSEDAMLNVVIPISARASKKAMPVIASEFG